LKVMQLMLQDMAGRTDRGGEQFVPGREVIMKKLSTLSAVLLLSTAAEAQYTFDYGARTLRIDPDRGTAAPQQTPSLTATAREPPVPTANVAPAAILTPPQPAASRPKVLQQAAAAKPAAAPVGAVAPAAGSRSPATAVQAKNSPLGVWLTEDKDGKVRIEQCGANLCGYAVDEKSNKNSEQILIDMKPGKDSKWSGRIVDPNTGSTYDSTIALKASNTLRVEGCVFGGIFCGGQTWTRVN
jgi:uncharacterized protein (DUF2147 family)